MVWPCEESWRGGHHWRSGGDGSWWEKTKNEVEDVHGGAGSGGVYVEGDRAE